MNSAAVNEQVNELICPITMELPIDPVTAEDGRMYERTAIEKFIRNSKTGLLRSPITNIRMGPNLYPAIQTKNIIDIIIKSGAVDDKSMIENWNERRKDQKMDEETIQEAKSGDLESSNYLSGDSDVRTIPFILIMVSPLIYLAWCVFYY